MNHTNDFFPERATELPSGVVHVASLPLARKRFKNQFRAEIISYL
jgi:hypothetical protein